MSLKSVIKKDDVEEALRSYLGSESVPDFDYEVSKGAEKVQGLLSIVVRVHVTFKSAKEDVTFIAKRPPISEVQLQYTKDLQVYWRESQFFNVAQPILLQKFRKGEYPIVRCYFADAHVTILEDLTPSGYQTVSKPVSRDNYCSLDVDFADLIVRKTARFHLASLGTDWMQIMPHLAKDGHYEGPGRDLMEPRLRSRSVFVSEVMKLEFPETYQKYGDWFTSEKCYDKIVELCKPSKEMRNVLCHGDIWENNIMFHLNESGQPQELKMIDLQLVRFCPGSIDLLYFLYLCTDKAFRDAHEVDLLTSYVEDFNANCPESEAKLSLAELQNEYNRCRLYGVIISAIMRPACFLGHGWVAENDGEINEQVIKNFIEGVPVENLIESFHNDPVFRKSILILTEELLSELDKVCLTDEK